MRRRRSRCRRRGELDALKVTFYRLIVLVGRREEVTEKGLRLPFGSVLELDPHVHTTGTGKCRIQTFQVIGGAVLAVNRVPTTQMTKTHAKRMRPSAAATPSKALRRPLKLRVLTSEMWSLWRLWRLLEGCSGTLASSPLLVLESGVPFELLSRETLRVNAASKSSRRTMQRAGTRPISVVRVLSLIHDEDRERVYMSSINSPAIAWIKELFPDPGTPWRR